ncbi:MAG: HAMP domain-containing sensor histidine kinase [Singulisphaera sp.]
MTDRKHAEEERESLLAAAQEARGDAEAANRMKDEFLATLSHERRTPLNAILGWAKILRSGQVDEEDLEEGLAAIERNSTAQAQIIEDLLDISRIVSGNFKLEVQRFDIREVIEASIAAVMPAATAKGIRVHKLLDSLAGPVSGDPARLQQVVWNLVTNAIKFTPKGGKVQVLLERVNSHLEISVIDTGMGIKPEFLPHVFDRFRQADSTTTRRHGGLGLGLAIVKQLVEIHGGTVRARARRGPGLDIHRDAADHGRASGPTRGEKARRWSRRSPKTRSRRGRWPASRCSSWTTSPTPPPDPARPVGMRGGGRPGLLGGRSPGARRAVPARRHRQRRRHARTGRL